MESKIFLPKKIKVGFNKREDTYTGMLGYVIPFDGKKWRQEVSWEGWRQKPGAKVHVGYEKNANGTFNYNKAIQKTLGAELEPQEFDNEPMEGFVINKGAGGKAGSSSSWNIRNEVIRVYDPRGFEFEISVPNIIYILQNANSFKGKGLEGKFIFGWEGKQLVLIPEEAPEYQQMVNFTTLQAQKVSVRDLIKGAKYKTKQLQDLVYIDRFDETVFKYNRSGYKTRERGSDYLEKKAETKNMFVFYDQENKGYITLSGISTIAELVDSNPVSDYAEIVDGWFKLPRASKPKAIHIKKFITIHDLRVESKASAERKVIYCYNKIDDKNYQVITYQIEQEQKNQLKAGQKDERPYNWQNYETVYWDKNYWVSVDSYIIVKDDGTIEQWHKGSNNVRGYSSYNDNVKTYIDKNQFLKEFQLCELEVELENGQKFNLSKF